MIEARAGAPAPGHARPWRIALAVLLALSLVAAACGGDDDDAAPADDADDVDPDGVLKVAFADVGGQIFSLDPAGSNNIGDTQHQLLIYGTPLRQTGPTEFEPWLAESVDVPDPRTVTLKLRDDVTFSDGAEYDAAVLKRNIERNLAGTGPGTGAATFNQVVREIQSIEVDGPLELTFKLKSDVAGSFYEVLAGRETMAASPKALDAGVDLEQQPVGAGPYVLERYVPGSIFTLRKNADFFDADAWPLGGIDFVNVTAGVASVNAIRAGDVDIATIPAADGKQLEGDNSFRVETTRSDFGFQFLAFCTDRPPFQDERVRKAIQHAIDRDAVVQAVGGTAEPGYGLWRSDSPNYNEDVEEIAGYDPDEAKKLLQQAGATNLTFDIGTLASQPNITEVLISQLGKVGINAKLVITNAPVDDFYVNLKFLTASYPAARPGIQRYLRPLSKDSIANPCKGDYADVMEVVREIQALPPDDPDVTELYQEAERLVAEGAYIIPFLWQNGAQAMKADTVGGEPRYIGPNLQYDSIYRKA
jgi:peptide/nickel transport system substrate-binding protein